MTNNTTNTTQANLYYHVEFHYQSWDIDFTHWISLFTISLAPLIAHVVAGAPSTVYLSSTFPRWHDKIVLYNPVSIIWRYLAITERCLCTRGMTTTDIAATNVVFWTSQGWDGSEATMRESKNLCVRRPRPAAERLVSADAFQTLIVGLQGVGAACVVLPGPMSGSVDSLTTVFLPLALVGLLRLPAAFWLTDDHLFANRIDGHELHVVEQASGSPRPHPHLHPKQISATAVESFAPIEADSTLTSTTQDLQAWAVRMVYILFLLFALGLCFYRTLEPILDGELVTLTVCLLDWFYLYLLISCIGIISAYIFKRQSRRTVIPCAGLTWYKVHTCLTILLALLVFVVAALETWMDHGTYTTEVRTPQN